jgi:P-type Mg2+ transporter
MKRRDCLNRSSLGLVDTLRDHPFSGTVSFIPGGLGTFEAAAVLMLKIDGIPVAVGLSTALLFRGLTFFLPMAPGLWFSRRINRSASSP